MPALIATRRFTYGTRRLSADDTFVATRTDAGILVGLGKAKYATRAILTPEDNPASDAPPVTVENDSQTTAPAVESKQPETTTETAAEAPKRRGRPPKAKN